MHYAVVLTIHWPWTLRPWPWGFAFGLGDMIVTLALNVLALALYSVALLTSLLKRTIGIYRDLRWNRWSAVLLHLINWTTKSLTIMFLSTNNKCSPTNESFYALNMKLSGDSLLICSEWSAVFRQTLTDKQCLWRTCLFRCKMTTLRKQDDVGYICWETRRSEGWELKILKVEK